MIEVDIVSPTKRLVEGARVNSLKIPAIKGELEILPGHAELLTLLSTGMMTLVSDGQTRRFAVSFGFAEVRNDKVLVLAETIEDQNEIDIERAKLAQKNAEAKLVGVLEEGQFKKYQLKLQRALIRQVVS